MRAIAVSVWAIMSGGKLGVSLDNHSQMEIGGRVHGCGLGAFHLKAISSGLLE